MMLKKGDTIKCHDEDEIIYLMGVLEREGHGTDFLYELNGEKGLWLEITKGIRRKRDEAGENRSD